MYFSLYRNLEFNGMGTLGINMLKQLPDGTSIRFLNGNPMSCVPARFQTTFDSISSSLPQCQVGECHVAALIHFRDFKTVS
jgi:hypothetical protein